MRLQTQRGTPYPQCPNTLFAPQGPIVRGFICCTGGSASYRGYDRNVLRSRDKPPGARGLVGRRVQTTGGDARRSGPARSDPQRVVRSLTIRPSQFRSLAPRPTEQERTTSAGVGLGIGRRESPNSPWGKNAAASLSRSLEDLPTVFDFRRCYRRIRNFVVPLSSAVPVDRSGRHVPAADGMMQGEDGKMKPCEERETCDRRAIGSRSRIASG